MKSFVKLGATVNNQASFRGCYWYLFRLASPFCLTLRQLLPILSVSP
jgi:hypothetical protein